MAEHEGHDEESAGAKSGFDPVGDVAGVMAGLIEKATGGGHDHGNDHHHSRFTHFIDEWGEWGFSRGFLMIFLFTTLFVVASSLMPVFPRLVAGWLFFTMPVWLTVGLITGLWKAWVWYVRSLFIHEQKTVLLEMKFPDTIVKSPRAMEAALAGFWAIDGETTYIDRYWEGGVRTWYSFEMAGFNGEVHFYVWCWQKYRSRIESYIYAQYPEIELVEAEDYAMKFQYDPKVNDLFANQMVLEKEDSHGANVPGRAPKLMGIYPIRSYIEFEMDKDLKEEYKTDPLAIVVERLSHLKETEQAWAQIMFTASFKDAEYREACQDEVEALRRESSKFRDDLTDEESRTMRARGTWRQLEQIQAIERHMGKRHFDVGIRICYIANHEHYNGVNRNSIRWLFVPYNSWFLNRMRPKRWHGDFDYPWQDFQGVRWVLTIRRFLDAYRRRSYFHAPWISPTMIMSTESIASIFHPPSGAIKSPGLRRIPSAKAAPPPNLPT